MLGKKHDFLERGEGEMIEMHNRYPFFLNRNLIWFSIYLKRNRRWNFSRATHGIFNIRPGSGEERIEKIAGPKVKIEWLPLFIGTHVKVRHSFEHHQKFRLGTESSYPSNIRTKGSHFSEGRSNERDFLSSTIVHKLPSMITSNISSSDHKQVFR